MFRIAASRLAVASVLPVRSAAISAAPLLQLRSYSVKSSSSTRTTATLPEDSALISALKSEIEHEEQVFKDNAAETAANTPKCLQELLGQKDFVVKQSAGASEVTLVREIKSLGEKITVTFSIDDVENAEYLDAEEHRGNGIDIDEDGNPTSMSENNSSDEMRIPVSVVITVTKKNMPDALVLQAIAEDGAFNIGNVSHTNDGSTALEISAEADFKRRGLYMGPSFESLDDGVREALDAYLSARGIDDSLAEAIPLFVKRKEQEEYRKWLSKVHNFVSSTATASASS